MSNYQNPQQPQQSNQMYQQGQVPPYTNQSTPYGGQPAQGYQQPYASQPYGGQPVQGYQQTYGSQAPYGQQPQQSTYQPYAQPQPVIIQQIVPPQYDPAYENAKGAGTTALVFGILSLFLFHLIFGIIALSKASDCARFIPNGTPNSRAGKICAIIGLILIPFEFFFFIFGLAFI